LPAAPSKRELAPVVARQEAEAMSNYHYRRGTIFWALILITVGVLFLAQNFNPSLHPWQVIAKFWPVLIILWGISKLVDYLYIQSHPDEPAPRLFSGGEVVLLILVLMLGTLISKIVLHPWRGWSGYNDRGFASLFLNSYVYTQTLSVPAGASPHLVIVDRWGDVEIHGGGTSSLDATVKETIRAENDSEAHQAADRLKVEIVQQGGNYILQSNLDSLPHRGRNVRLDLTLRVPKNTGAEITAERGDIIAQGLTRGLTATDKGGDLHANSIVGLVRVRKTGGLTRIREVKGSVEIDGRGRDINVSGVSGTVTVNGDFTGSVEFSKVLETLQFTSSRTDLNTQRVLGHLTMDMGSLDARGIQGPLQISTAQKDISVEDFSSGLTIKDVNGDVRLQAAEPPRQPIAVDLRRGGIELTLPSSSAFQMDARSSHGDVQCDFPGLKVSKGGGNPSISGAIGQGGPLIRLSTTYGTIRLQRAGAPASAATPSGGSQSL
jgi:DUF4097 and DUF4098 domain-containing protein YvlB